MIFKSSYPAICAAFSFSIIAANGGALAADDFTAQQDTPSPMAIPNFDALRFTATQTGGMDFENGPGDLSVTNFNLNAFLSRPISLTSSLTMIPMFSYSYTKLDFDKAVFPVGDEDFHSAALQAIFIQDIANSPWFGIGWTRAELATDYQAIGTEDVTFDVALGVGYKVSDTFTVGAGFVVTNLGGDVEFFPGVNFFWTPCEDFTMALYGPNFLARYNMNDNWFISGDIQPGGGTWNINDAQGNSRSVVLDSYWASVSTHHRICGELWFSAGIGYAFGNEIEIHGNHGTGPSTSSELEGAPLAQIGLSLHDW
ncbi:MAG: DUF6268 family outer membrane beta-barrel protein [Akkermansiaceae bacterium]|jgi:hypothetical protein|nr:DUF6268 family outer membrane beta-barrel protein [Akkermansiaceae bacterium]MDP4645520.1 DUF6268 family outer membrane beta-barrel protein [Akkermansiaceae bacterium]MDP4719863.1 DUF6268 family outer membrane beta-barrel protein [Akkermansiaceae bacterium]MDP4778673.1 DUF6268 family outer membrane beta-barrel protein [Akkermansiaceae bacterium]MDP4848265.1 DUF6268 family outer membrane beta-barrel protein [Akkermansiaceae bacterium]